ncbi:lamin tail domain-containing protein [Halorubrum sp. BOL3-1]|uniref:lamin tail domain-containing protein n=1 Tax=Halorubrum sp. BOL3-1 TaxID=2497325 RepID=UPI001004F284|nr:lamin tail domain-containing protein [Halorubrum sp. BOL3-1]QAU14006.1 lamin tail domain-containing protein [Halorubrum sp. BOL3-1]
MSDGSPIRSRTSWHRLSPYARNSTGNRGLRAEVHDPLWLLGRQWQVGEFAGEDAGSPVKVDFWYEHDEFERVDLAPGDPETPSREYDPTVDGPLETLVERETVTVGPAERPPDRETAAEAGRYFLTLLDELGYEVGGERVTAAEFPESLRLGPPDRPVDAGGRRFLSVAGDRTLDGHALYVRLVDDGNVLAADGWDDVVWDDVGLPTPTNGSVTDAYREAAKGFGDWYADLYDEPDPEAEDADDAWNGDRMEYEFRASTGTGDDETVYAADEYAGGTLDWDAFSVVRGASATLTPGESGDGSDDDGSEGGDDSTDDGRSEGEFDVPPDVDMDALTPGGLSLSDLLVTGEVDPDETIVPTKVTFPGMPSTRWWEFEDGEVNLNEMNAGPGELGKLLVTEHALLYGNDWFQIPIEAPIGSLTRITELTVTDTFGEVTRALPTPSATESGDADDAGDLSDELGEGPLAGASRRSGGWNVFMHTHLPNHDRPGVLLPPTLATHHESDPVERVVLARDEVANAAFGVEFVVEDAVGDALRWREFEPPTLDIAAVDPDDDVDEESIRLENPGEVPVAVGGWSIESDAGETYSFPSGAAVPPGASVTVHTGSGTDHGSDRYWDAGAPVWADANHVTLFDADGGPVDSAFVGSPVDAAMPRYHLVTDVPDNWFPLRMRRVDPTAVWEIPELRFELSRLLDPEPGIPEPSGKLLEPDLSLYDEELTRTGMEVTRTYQYARWVDGGVRLWTGRRAGPGLGEGQSGLRYDVVRPRSNDRRPEE